MTDIVTAVYESKLTTLNAYNDLVSTGIPRELIRIDEGKKQIQVLMPHATEPEAIEIMQRHLPVSLTS